AAQRTAQLAEAHLLRGELIEDLRRPRAGQELQTLGDRAEPGVARLVQFSFHATTLPMGTWSSTVTSGLDEVFRRPARHRMSEHGKRADGCVRTRLGSDARRTLADFQERASRRRRARGRATENDVVDPRRNEPERTKPRRDLPAVMRSVEH